MHLLKLVVLVLAILGVLFLLDRLALWAERRGWIFWRNSKSREITLGSITLELQKIFESGKARHVLEAKHDQNKETVDGTWVSLKSGIGLRSGAVHRIGTNEPGALARAINQTRLAPA